MLAILCPALPAVNSPSIISPAPAGSTTDAWWKGYELGKSGSLTDAPAGLAAMPAAWFEMGYSAGLDHFLAERRLPVWLDHTAADEAELLGFELGAAGISVDLASDDEPERSAFVRGLDLAEREAILADLARREEEADWAADAELAERERGFELLAREAGGWDRAANVALI